MGNTPSGSSTIQLGKSASMAVSRSHGNGYFGAESYNHEEQSATFHVDDRTTTSSIRKFKKPSSNRVERFVITITDSDQKVKSWRVWPYRFEMVVETTQQNQHLNVSHAKTGVIQDVDVLWVLVAAWYKGGVSNPLNLYDKNALNNPMKMVAADGIVTFTYLNFYRVQGNDKQKGLVVIEVKKKSMEESPFEVIVSHYFASLGKTKAGFSVVAKMRGGDGDCLKLEGPILHPATDLFEMFDKVSKKGHWSPNLCPHCAKGNNNKSDSNQGSVGGATNGRSMRIQNKPKGGGGGLESLFPGKVQMPESESEDSDDGDDDSEATTSKGEPSKQHRKRVTVVKKNLGIIVYQ